MRFVEVKEAIEDLGTTRILHLSNGDFELAEEMQVLRDQSAHASAMIRWATFIAIRLPYKSPFRIGINPAKRRSVL